MHSSLPFVKWAYSVKYGDIMEYFVLQVMWKSISVLHITWESVSGTVGHGCYVWARNEIEGSYDKIIITIVATKFCKKKPTHFLATHN